MTEEPATYDATTIKHAMVVNRGKRTAAAWTDSMSEKEWSQTVYDAARWNGWRAYRVLNSKGSTPGVPDLLLLRESRIIFAELKTERGRLSTAQREWLDALALVPSLETYVWRPSDWPQIETLLR